MSSDKELASRAYWLGDDKMGKKTTGSTSGPRPALIERIDFVKLMCAKIDIGKDGRATGFKRVVAALQKHKAFAGKDEAYCKMYVKNKHRQCIKSGINLPVFTDIPVASRGRRRSVKEENDIVGALLRANGVEANLVNSIAEKIRVELKSKKKEPNQTEMDLK